jgi:hypothetical protein
VADVTNPDLQWACDELKGSSQRIRSYATYEKYYDGKHPLAFATRKFRSVFWGIFSQFADNLCESVVDIQAERLEVIGFTSNDAETNIDAETGVAATRDRTADAAWDLWEDSDLDLVADEVHKDVMLYGDGFTITDDDGTIWPQAPKQMAARYSETKPGMLDVAAKIWPNADGTLNLNLYYPDRIEHYKTERKPTTSLKSNMFVVAGDDDATDSMQVSHFPNRAFSCYGRSELIPVLPLQDALNKSVIDTIVAMEYQAFRQRWITGVDVELDDSGKPKNITAAHGAGEYITLPGEEAKVGEFGQMDVAPLQAVSDSFRAEVARVSGIPLYYFYVGTGGASETGESLKTSELRFTRKGKRQHRCLGKAWERAVTTALVATGDVDKSEAAALDLNIIWERIEPRSESEKMDVLIKKQSIGVPNGQLQKEAGYDADQVVQFAAADPDSVVNKSTLEAGSKNAPDAAPTEDDAPPGPAAPVSSVPQHGGAEPVK